MTCKALLYRSKQVFVQYFGKSQTRIKKEAGCARAPSLFFLATSPVRSKSHFKITFQNYISKSHLRHRIYERIQHLLVGRMKRALNRQHILENRCSLER